MVPSDARRPPAKAEHKAALPLLEQIRAVADALSSQESGLAPAHELLDRLGSELLPHERADAEMLAPPVSRALQNLDAPRRSAAPIRRSSTGRRGPPAAHRAGQRQRAAEDAVEFRGNLHGLYAVLCLHNVQEEEGALALVPTGTESSGRRPASRHRPRPGGSETSLFYRTARKTVGGPERHRDRRRRVFSTRLASAPQARPQSRNHATRRPLRALVPVLPARPSGRCAEGPLWAK